MHSASRVGHSVVALGTGTVGRWEHLPVPGVRNIEKYIRLYMCERGWRMVGYNQTLYFTVPVVLRWDLLVFFWTKNASITAQYVLESIMAGLYCLGTTNGILILKTIADDCANQQQEQQQNLPTLLSDRWKLINNTQPTKPSSLSCHPTPPTK
jgi:hypothetical protein